MTSPPALGRIRRRTVLLGGLGAAAIAGVPAAWLLLDAKSSPHITLTGHTDSVRPARDAPVGQVSAS
jgi:hypothetical protein